MSLHILAIETSGNCCGVALLRHDSGRVEVVQRTHEGVAEHSSRLLPMAQDVLAEAGVTRSQLDAVAFGQGPGGFTGLRVACGVAQGLGFALDIPVLAIGSHAAVEYRLPSSPGLRLVALDARMQEAYVAVFDRESTQVRMVQPPVLLSTEALGLWATTQVSQWRSEVSEIPLLVGGDVFGDYPELFDVLPGARVLPGVFRPDVDGVARLALSDWLNGARPDAAAARPLYVRDKVAFTIKERERGAGGNPKAGDQF